MSSYEDTSNYISRIAANIAIRIKDPKVFVPAALLALAVTIYPKLRNLLEAAKDSPSSRHLPAAELLQYKSEDDLRKEYGWSDRAWSIAKCQGPYTPLYPNRRAYEESKAKIPEGYELTQVNILMRHTARYPTKSAHREIVAALKKLNKPPFETDVAIEDYVREIEAWGGDDGVLGHLTEVGESALFGAEFAARYRGFVVDSSDEPPFVRSSGTPRAVETAKCFTQGFQRHLPPHLHSILESAPHQIYHPKERNADNGLGETCCNPFLVDVGSSVELRQYQAEELHLLNRHLHNHAIDGVAVKETDIIHLLSLAAYDKTATTITTAVDTEISSGESRIDKKNWLDAMLHDDEDVEAHMWHRYAYWYDIKKYYSRNLGDPDCKYGGFTWVKDLTHRLTGSPLIDETRTAQSLESEPNKISSGGKRMFIDFSHDNRMLAILGFMGIVSRNDPLEVDFCPKRTRDFDQGRLSPFGMNLVVERWSPSVTWWQRLSSFRPFSQAEDLVRILLNDEPVLPNHPACKDSQYARLNMCNLSEFEQSQDLATKRKRFAELCAESKAVQT